MLGGFIKLMLRSEMFRPVISVKKNMFLGGCIQPSPSGEMEAVGGLSSWNQWNWRMFQDVSSRADGISPEEKTSEAESLTLREASGA